MWKIFYAEGLLKAGIKDIKTLAEAKKAMGILQDNKSKEKILNFVNRGRSITYIKEKINEYYLKEAKRAYQAMVDNNLFI